MPHASEVQFGVRTKNQGANAFLGHGRVDFLRRLKIEFAPNRFAVLFILDVEQGYAPTAEANDAFTPPFRRTFAFAEYRSQSLHQHT